MMSRRKFFSNAVVTAGATALGATTRSLQGAEPVGQPLENPERIKGNAQSDQQDYPPGEPGKDYTPVITPNGSTLPYKVVGGIKVFHLIAEEVDHEFAPGLRAHCWGFTGTVCWCHQVWMEWRGSARKISSPARPTNTSLGLGSTEHTCTTLTPTI